MLRDLRNSWNSIVSRKATVQILLSACILRANFVITQMKNNSNTLITTLKKIAIVSFNHKLVDIAFFPWSCVNNEFSPK